MTNLTTRTPPATQAKPRATLRIPVAEARDFPLEELTPFEFDSFFGSFFADTAVSELTQ